MRIFLTVFSFYELNLSLGNFFQDCLLQRLLFLAVPPIKQSLYEDEAGTSQLTHPCSILTFTGGGVASGILSGSPGPLAGGPTSDMSGMLDEKKNNQQEF